jgi:serine kinase of HPr protein (carbohydrate metabolism regulator)
MSGATVHASAVLVGEIGVLIRGASGSGKSSLALALIEADPLTTRLVADDRIWLAAAHGRLMAVAPPAIAGLLEIRGQGIVRLPHASPVVIRFVADLAPALSSDRLPDESEASALIEGVAVPRLKLPENAPDAALRLRARLFHSHPKNL